MGVSKQRIATIVAAVVAAVAFARYVAAYGATLEAKMGVGLVFIPEAVPAMRAWSAIYAAAVVVLVVVSRRRRALLGLVPVAVGTIAFLVGPEAAEARHAVTAASLLTAGTLLWSFVRHLDAPAAGPAALPRR